MLWTGWLGFEGRAGATLSPAFCNRLLNSLRMQSLPRACRTRAEVMCAESESTFAYTDGSQEVVSCYIALLEPLCFVKSFLG